MEKLRQAYDMKKNIIENGDMLELEKALKKSPNIDNVNVNSDGTMRLESNSGMDSLNCAVENTVLNWIKQELKFPVSIICNTLPINHNACILKV